MRWRARHGVLAAAVVLVTSVATSAATPASLVPDPPFDHAIHGRPLEKAGLVCVDCHPVGLEGPEGAEPPAVSPNLEACHGCHRRMLPGAPRRAPSACKTCHDELAPIKPEDHDQAWLTGHALEARAFRADCKDCHELDTCTRCHEDRGPTATNPHPPAFRAVHGVEARLDPRSCASCHTGETCATCHATGAGGGQPW